MNAHFKPLLLAIWTFFVTSPGVMSVHADTWLIPDEFPTIQDALNSRNPDRHVKPGDMIQVAPGTYPPFMVIEGIPNWSNQFQLHIYSEAGPEMTIIDGSLEHIATGIYIDSHSNIIEGFTVRNAAYTGYHLGVGVQSTGEANQLRNLIIENNAGHGIIIGQPHGNSNIIESCVVRSNGWNKYIDYRAGIYVLGNDNLITNCTVYGNHQEGILIGWKRYPNNYPGNTVTDCVLFENSDPIYYGSGVYVCLGVKDALVVGNHIFNNDLGIVLAPTNMAYNNAVWGNNRVNYTGERGHGTGNSSKRAGKNIIGGSFIGGNFWGDYGGQDLDGDGLGDTEVPYNYFDFLPLVGGLADLSVSSLSVSNVVRMTVEGPEIQVPVTAILSNTGEAMIHNIPVCLLINGYTNSEVVIPQLIPHEREPVSFVWNVRKANGLVFRDLIASNVLGQLCAELSAEIKVLANPRRTIVETNFSNNAAEQTAYVRVVPDLQLTEATLVQTIFEEKSLISGKPMAMRVQAALTGRSAEFFKEIRDIQLRTYYDDGNPNQTLTGCLFVLRDETN